MTCANCGRSRGATVKGCTCIPDWFWDEPEVARAVAEEDAAEVIRQLRRRVPDLKQWPVARMCGVHQSTISRVERGRPLDRNLAHTALEGLGAPLTTPVSSRLAQPPTVTPPTSASLRDLYESELLHHLSEQWHHLVKTDNLLGPRAALRGVCEQIRIITELLDLSGTNLLLRQSLLSLASRYAESASWLCEDSADLSRAQEWSAQAVQWAYEAEDEIMLAWAYFRKSQQSPRPEHSLALVTTAQRQRHILPTPMRAALLQHQATTLARLGEETGTHSTFDQALEWAVDTDTDGDARAGHGSFCTPDYIALERARAWTLLGSPQRAVEIYEHVIPRLPVVYQRDRGVALARCALAHRATGEVERAADLARQAWGIARATGTGRAVNDVVALAEDLRPHRAISAVGDLLTRIDETREN